MANGTIAASQLEMLTQSGTGIVTIIPPNTNTNRTLTLPDVTGTVTTLGTIITLAAAVASTSGTAIDFTGIPSWAKRITVMFSGVGTTGTSLLLLQIGSSAGVESAGYQSASNYSTTTAGSAFGSGFYITAVVPAASVIFSGAITISLFNSNIYTQVGNICDDGQRVSSSSGRKSLSGVLDRVRVTTLNGTDTFDAGLINIMYEG